MWKEEDDFKDTAKLVLQTKKQSSPKVSVRAKNVTSMKISPQNSREEMMRVHSSAHSHS